MKVYEKVADIKMKDIDKLFPGKRQGRLMSAKKLKESIKEINKQAQEEYELSEEVDIIDQDVLPEVQEALTPLPEGIEPCKAIVPEAPTPITAQEFALVMSKELERIKELDIKISKFEEILLDDSFLYSLSPKEKTELYNAIVSRKDSSHNFFIKMMNLGLKAQFLGEVLNPPQEEVVRKIKPVSKQTKEIASQITSLIEQKLKERVGKDDAADVVVEELELEDEEEKWEIEEVDIEGVE